MSRLAIMEPSDLVAKELQERLEKDPLFCEQLQLLSVDADRVGTLARVGGAAGMVQRFDPEVLADTDVLFVCGGALENGWEIDSLPAELGVVILAPDVAQLGLRPVIAGWKTSGLRSNDHLQSPDPAVVGVAHLLLPLVELGLSSAVATVLRPVSTSHADAFEEAFEQVRSLLNFQPIRTGKHFSHQVVFNLLPTSNEEARLVVELRSVLEVPGRLALRTLQAGVFHGLSIALHCEFEESTDIEAVREALEANPRLTFTDEPATLGPIDTAAADQILVGAIHPAEPEKRAFWLWAVMDNLTVGGAINGIGIAKEMLGVE